MTAYQILMATARYHEMPAGFLTGITRRRDIVLARQVVAYLTRKHTGASYPEIGRILGGRHHSTIISAERRIAKNLREMHHETIWAVQGIEQELGV